MHTRTKTTSSDSIFCVLVLGGSSAESDEYCLRKTIEKTISDPVVFCLCTGVMIVMTVSSNGMIECFINMYFPVFLFKYF